MKAAEKEQLKSINDRLESGELVDQRWEIRSILWML